MILVFFLQQLFSKYRDLAKGPAASQVWQEFESKQKQEGWKTLKPTERSFLNHKESDHLRGELKFAEEQRREVEEYKKTQQQQIDKLASELNELKKMLGRSGSGVVSTSTATTDSKDSPCIVVIPNYEKWKEIFKNPQS